MAQVLSVPEIKGIDALLELVTNPDKLASYLLKLKEMTDAVNERLADLDTKKKADDYLANATQSAAEAASASAQANEQLSSANVRAVAILADASEKAASVAKDREELEAAKAVFESTTKAQREADAVMRANIEKREADVLRRESSVFEREKVVAAEETRLQGLLADFRSKISA